MQPTNLQVQRSLAALRTGDGGPVDDDQAAAAAPPRDEVLGELPKGLLEDLGRGPAVRADRLAEAKGRLDQGEQPSPDELANRIVGRLVCDRLR